MPPIQPLNGLKWEHIHDSGGGGVDLNGCWFSVQCQCGQSQSNDRHKEKSQDINDYQIIIKVAQQE